MSQNTTDREIEKLIPANLITLDIQQDISGYLVDKLKKKIIELYNFKKKLQLTQSQNPTYLELANKIYNSFFEEFTKTIRENTTFLLGKKNFLITLNDITVRERENSITRDLVRSVGQDYYTNDYSNFLWTKTLKELIQQKNNDINLIKSTIMEISPDFFSELNLNYQMDADVEAFFLMYYVEEWILKLLFILARNGNTKYLPHTRDPRFNLPKYEFMIFTNPENLEDTKLLNNIGTASFTGGGKKSKSKSNSRYIKSKKQNKTKKIKKSKK